jgi:DNA-binding MarR family transcriptional regulator
MDDEDETVTIRRAVIRLARRLRVERPETALSSNKVGVLAHLHRNGPTSPGALAAAEHQQPQSLTRVFADLERTGLIVRSPSEVDRRHAVLAITTEGRHALARDMAQRDRWLESALQRLTETERQVLLLAARLMDRVAET